MAHDINILHLSAAAFPVDSNYHFKFLPKPLQVRAGDMSANCRIAGRLYEFCQMPFDVAPHATSLENSSRSSYAPTIRHSPHVLEAVWPEAEYGLVISDSS